MKISKKAILSMLVISLTLVGLLLISMVAGYRYFSVISPSMGETAPVGSLVVTQKSDNFSEGDIVSYYRGSRVYTHRIIKVSEDGNFVTKGDLNSVNDSIPLKKSEIIGKSIFIGKYLGWVWSAIPILAIGMVIVYFVSCLKRVKDQWRWPIRIIGYAIVVVITTFIVNPWLRVEALNFEVFNKGVNIKMVNTGVFPLSNEKGGRFYAGQVETIYTDQLDDKGRFIYLPRPSLGFWGVIFVIIWCLAPIAIAMVVRIPPDDDFDNLSNEEIEEEKTRNLIIFTAILIVSILITALQVSTLAGFTAVVVNDNNTVRTSEYFTCESAHALSSDPRPLLAYSLSTYSSQSNVENDISGNGRNGQMTGNFSHASTNNQVCPRDTIKTGLKFSPQNRTCVARNELISGPNTFSLEIWFRTSTRDNGKLIGFGAQRNGGGLFLESGSAYNDRHVYMHNGVLHFGLYPNRLTLLRSRTGVDYADNKWHHLVVTTSPSLGSKMYIDGEMIASNNIGGGQNYRGYWKMGCGRMAGWRGANGQPYNGPGYYDGDLHYAAIYDTVLTDSQIMSRYIAGS